MNMKEAPIGTFIYYKPDREGHCYIRKIADDLVLYDFSQNRDFNKVYKIGREIYTNWEPL